MKKIKKGRPYMPRSKSNEWATPWWLFDMLDAEFGFTIDAAASESNARLDDYWDVEINGLSQDWSEEVVWLNPPYPAKSLNAWAKKAFESRHDATTVMLVPVKADQAWWHDYALNTEIRFIRGRIAFSNAPAVYPGPLCVLVFGPDIGPSVSTLQIPKGIKKTR